MRIASALPLIAVLIGCSPEGFEITPCSSNGKLAFRVHEIDGWLRNYQPRPYRVWVVEVSEDPADLHRKQTWATEIGNWDAIEDRPAREVVIYGDQLPGWETSQPAAALRDGVSHSAVMMDGGRMGEARFIAGQHLPKC